MAARYIAIWFRHLLTDWYIRKHPAAKELPVVFADNIRGKQVIVATSKKAEQSGIFRGMAVADAKALLSEIEIITYVREQENTLLLAIGEWCIRYSPVVAVDVPDGLIIDAGGCAHLWGGEQAYLRDLITRLRDYGYDVRAAMADTVGTAWAISRYGTVKAIIGSGQERAALLPLPPAALRLEEPLPGKFQKLGFHTISSFIHLPLPVLRRRFGHSFITRLQQALGNEREDLSPIQIAAEYEERLPCMDPVKTATAITIAISRLLEDICERLAKDAKGLRTALLVCYRIDDQIIEVEIGTNRATHNAPHLLKLFELKIPGIAPGEGIDLFVLKVMDLEEVVPPQEKIWAITGQEEKGIAELLDRIAGKIGEENIQRYQPAQRYWPERSLTAIASLQGNTTNDQQLDRPRPMKLLETPLPVEVTAPIPDYPPMLFRYQHQLHTIKKADGPERIEREWWLDGGEHRDYYVVEDSEGQRYWLFRSGHYSGEQSQWFIHGFFA